MSGVTQLSVAGLPQTVIFYVVAAVGAATGTAVNTGVSPSAGGNFTTLSVMGTPMGAGPTVVAAVGASQGAAGVSAQGVGGAENRQGVAASQGVATVAAIGVRQFGSVGASAGRVAGSDATSSPIVSRVGASAGIATVTGLSLVKWTTLGVNGLPGSFYEFPDKLAITYRTWAITDYFYFGLNIGDFTAFEFDLIDSFAFSATETLGFAGSTAAASSVATVTGVARPIMEGVGASTPTATVTGAGATVAVFGGQGASAGAAVGDFRSVGSVIGQGVGNAPGAATGAGIGRSTFSAVYNAAGVASSLVYPWAITEIVGSSAGVATVDGTPSSLVAGQAAGSATAAAVSIVRWNAVGLSSAFGNASAVGVGGVSTDISRIELIASKPRTALRASQGQIELRWVA